MARRCKESFVTVDRDGNRARVGAGQLVKDDAAILETHGHLFEDTDEHLERRDALKARDPRDAVIEQATAAPGEKRATRRPPKAKS